MEEYNIKFNGYWIEGKISGIPTTSGIYLVYRCVHTEGSVILKEIIYIGQAKNLHDRINNHDKKDLFKKECEKGETVCYSVAEVAPESLDIVENALIFAQKPKLNAEDKEQFRFNIPVTFIVEGRCKLLKYQNFTIK